MLYQGVIDQATRKKLLLIKELIQFVLSGEIGEMDVSVMDTMRSLAEVMTSEIERPVTVGRGAGRPQVDIKEKQLRGVLSPSVPFFDNILVCIHCWSRVRACSPTRHAHKVVS